MSRPREEPGAPEPVRSIDEPAAVEPETDTTPEPEADTTPEPKADATPESEADTTPEPKADAAPEPEDEDQGASFHSMLDAATEPVRSVARPIGRGVGRLAAGAQRQFLGSPGARVRRVRRMGRQPLLNLYDVHPQAHQAAQRELGLRTVPLEKIRGTAVEGPAQRGGDFLPFRQLRGADWQARWRRIRSALDQLVDLPPVDLLKWGDEYWVVDGHNRVGAALYNGQVAVDANVTELRAPGVPVDPPRPIAAYLQGSLDLRAAGEGRLTKTAVRPEEWEQLPDAIAGGRGGADPGDEAPATTAIPGHGGHRHPAFGGDRTTVPTGDEGVADRPPASTAGDEGVATRAAPASPGEDEVAGGP